MTRMKRAVLPLLWALACAESAAAQAPLTPPKPGQQSLKVQVVLSRYQGEKKVSSLPYTLTVTPNMPGKTILRMGAQIPLATSISGTDSPVSSYSYREVGTSIDCAAATIEGGKYYLLITIEDSSIYPNEDGATAAGPGKAGPHPAFRSFKSDEAIVLSDGQSSQYTTATDKVTGEVVKVDVTLSVLK